MRSQVDDDILTVEFKVNTKGKAKLKGHWTSIFLCY